MVKRLSTMRETRVRSLGWEDPLEKEMAIHSSTIAWKISWTEEPGRLQSIGSQSRTRLSNFTSLHFTSLTGDQTCVSCFARMILNPWTTREVRVIELYKNSYV